MVYLHVVLLLFSVPTKSACDRWSVHASFAFVTLHTRTEGAHLWTLVTWSVERERVNRRIVVRSGCVELEVFHMMSVSFPNRCWWRQNAGFPACSSHT